MHQWLDVVRESRPSATPAATVDAMMDVVLHDGAGAFDKGGKPVAAPPGACARAPSGRAQKQIARMRKAEDGIFMAIWAARWRCAALSPLNDRMHSGSGSDHRRIRVYGAATLDREQHQPVKGEPLILFSEEAGCAVVPTLHDVERQTGQIDAWPAGHELLTPVRARALTLNTIRI
jgi:hypothetical protein